MLRYKFIIVAFCFLILGVNSTFAQEDNNIYIQDSILKMDPTLDVGIDPLRPSRAAFYSAILPGLGQAYNKKYWKIPVIYATLGVSTYAIWYNNDKYQTAREAYKLEKSGKSHDFEELSDETLERLQTSYKEDRDLAILITIGLYALQIVEASVDAHLQQIKALDKVSFKPTFNIDPITNKSVAGISFSFGF